MTRVLRGAAPQPRSFPSLTPSCCAAVAFANANLVAQKARETVLRSFSNNAFVKISKKVSITNTTMILTRRSCYYRLFALVFTCHFEGRSWYIVLAGRQPPLRPPPSVGKIEQKLLQFNVKNVYQTGNLLKRV